MLDGEEIIDQEALAETHVPHIARAPLSSYAANPELYGIGWNIDQTPRAPSKYSAWSCTCPEKVYVACDASALRRATAILFRAK